MKEGYIYIEDSRVVWNPEERPESVYYDSEGFLIPPVKVKKVLKQWQSKCVEVENAWYCHLNKCWCITKPHPEYRGEMVSPGQKAFIEGKTIIKLAA